MLKRLLQGNVFGELKAKPATKGRFAFFLINTAPLDGLDGLDDCRPWGSARQGLYPGGTMKELTFGLIRILAVIAASIAVILPWGLRCKYSAVSYTHLTLPTICSV